MNHLNYQQIALDLAAYNVRYVLSGSLAAALYGVPIQPRDFDIAPQLTPDNLQRLADLLGAWNARPLHHPDWAGSLSLEACAQWRPSPATEQQLDHLLNTPHGLFDVVPRISGEYTLLIERAFPVQSCGTTIPIAHPDDLIATMRPEKHSKHAARLPWMLQAKERVANGLRPQPLEQLQHEL